MDRLSAILRGGTQALGDAELIAPLLGTGLPGVLQLAQQLLEEFNGLGGLLHASANDLRRIKGLGPAKRAEIIAVIQLARRSLAQELQQRAVLTSPQQVKDFLSLKQGTAQSGRRCRARFFPLPTKPRRD